MTRLYARQHSERHGVVFEILDGHQMIAAIYEMPGRGIRVISKHAMTVEIARDGELNDVEIQFGETQA
jgi:hypothetical protein